jgi:protein transport protein SEC23
MGFAAQLDVQTSREFKITGAIGPCNSLQEANASVSDTEVGEGALDFPGAFC